VSSRRTESVLEEIVLRWPKRLSYAVSPKPEIIVKELGMDYGPVVLADRLLHSLLSKFVNRELRIPDAERIVKTFNESKKGNPA
jgi:hypothetical protein